MKSMPFFVPVLLLAFSLWGCGSLRNEVDPGELGAQTAKLVVSSFLSPQDSVLAVKLTRSQTVVGDSIGGSIDTTTILNAVVTIADGSRSVQLQYKADSKPYYSADARLLPIVAGKTYTLTVQIPAGERVTSTCTIPGPVSLSTVTFDSLASGRNQRYFIRARWQDPPGQTNYYQTVGVFQFILNCKDCDTKKEFSNLSFDDDNRGLFADIGTDGNEMISGRAYLTGANVSSAEQLLGFYRQYKSAAVQVNLFSIDQAYYQYWSAVLRQRRVRNNPFAEPVLVPSNIQGGLGCFAGYNSSTYTLKLK